MTNNKEEINTEEKFEEVEEVKEEVKTVKKPAPKKSSTSAANKDKQHVKELENEIESLKLLLAQALNQNKASARTEDVTIVYMSESLGVVKAGNVELRCTKFGETFTVSRMDFDMIVGKYRDWFDQGILAVAPENIEVAAAKGVRTSDEYNISPDKLHRLGRMSVNEIEVFWNTLTKEEHKLSVTQYFKRKLIEGTEPGYRDRAKIDLLNRLTNGGFQREAIEIGGGNLKIQPTELI